MTSPLTDAQWKPAKPCNSFSLRYIGKKQKTAEWRFHVGSFCLIRNQGLDGVPPEECTRDRYWKARIVEIRRPRGKSNAVCNPEHYLLVQWFYSADDIRQVMEGGDIEDLDRHLVSAAKQELYLSNHKSLVSSHEIATYVHDYEIIVLDNTILSHKPVVTYFSRYFWNSTDRCLQGKFIHCGLEKCTTFWNPDAEEQRFCWGCKHWFHTTCLPVDNITTQAHHLEIISTEHYNTPKSIVEIAFQPTARGGKLHYTAGNIRFVNKARLLLDHAVREKILSNPEPWMVGNIVDHEDDEDSLWWEYMVYEHNVDIEDKDTEQLVVTDQVFYKCPKCGSSL